MHRLGSHAVRPTAIRKAWKEYWPECRTDTSALVEREHLSGFAVVDVPDDAEARYWAGRIAVAVGWPQEVHRFA